MHFVVPPNQSSGRDPMGRPCLRLRHSTAATERAEKPMQLTPIMKAELNPSQDCTIWARRLRMRLFLAGGLLCPLAASAMGFRVPNQDAKATAFIATADNPSAIYYNPAGITQIKGSAAQMGFHVISINSHFDGENGS